MKRDAPCVVYSQDPDLIRRLCVYLEPVADVRPLTDPKRVSQVLEQAGPIALIADIRAAEVQPLLVMIKEEWPDVPIIVLGDLLSDPVFEAEQLDIYGAEDLDFNPRRLQSIVTHALECMTLSEESRLLKERVATLSAQANQHAAGDPRLAQRSPCAASLPRCPTSAT